MFTMQGRTSGRSELPDSTLIKGMMEEDSRDSGPLWRSQEMTG
jgi:hypothetical protein